MGAMMCGFLTLVFTVFPSILLNAGLSATGRLRNEAAAYVQRNTSDTLAKANTPADPRPMLPDPSRPADATP
jgi:hypothetical protein